MKVSYLLRSIATAVCIFVAASIGAANVNVTDFAGLKAALEGAADNDVITVSGVITSTEALTIAKVVKIEGTEGASIESVGTDRIFSINVPVGSGFVWIKGLVLSKGSVTGNGGAVAVSSGRVHFTDCIFEENTSSDGGGAVYGEGNDENPVDLEFYNCEFYDNFAAGNGGAIRVAVNTSLLTEHTIIRYNSSDKRGGALALNGPRRGVRLYHTLIDTNETVAKDAGSEGTGGIQCTGEFPLYIENSAITDNLGAGDHASAINLDGSITATIVNTTIARNQNGAKETLESKGSGGGTGSIWTTGGTGLTLTFVNVTYMGNVTAPDNNGGNSSGLSIQNAGPTIRIYNSLFLGNIAYTGFETWAPNGSVDIMARNTVTEFTIKNSIIGNIHSGGSLGDNFGGVELSGYITIADNPAIENKSLVDEYEYAANGDWLSYDNSGVYIEGGLLVLEGWKWYSLNEDAYAAQLGDANLLSDFDKSDDQFLAERDINSGTIWAGAVQGLYEDDEPELPEIAPDPIADEWGTSISKVNANIADQIKFNTIAENGSYINVDFGNYSGHAKGELISVNGRIVKTLFNSPINGKYPCNISGLASGIYLMKITLGNNNVVSKRILVK